MTESALVLFKEDIPKKGARWWRQFNTVIAPKQLESIIRQKELSFVDIGTLIDPGSVQEASELVRKLSLLKVRDGRRVSKVVDYQGYELWWIHYDDLMYKFCLPYTQYRRLLIFLIGFPGGVYLYKPVFSYLFSHFLDAHHRKYKVFEKFSEKIPPFGILFQSVISLPFLFWTRINKPRLMVWTSDLFDPPNDYDFRMKLIYEELRSKNIPFVEFVRSMESTPTVLRHILKRHRPVVYSYAITRLSCYLSSFLSRKSNDELFGLCQMSSDDPEEKFRFLVATAYLGNIRGDIWSIRVIKFILKFIGIKAAIITAANSRNFHEVLACKLSGIPSVGILHGVSSKNYNVYDFMPEFDGKKSLSVDKYGLWSEWWKDYYIENGKAYKSEQLHVSGVMRPFCKKNISANIEMNGNDGKIKVLFVSEQLAAPLEVMAYLSALLEVRDFSIFFKFRPYNDGFEQWLKEKRPDLLGNIDKEKIFRGKMNEAVSRCDVVVGSHSTGVLEALLLLKLPIFFRTNKWGDYFELESFESSRFLVVSPEELVDKIKKSKDIPLGSIKKLRDRFFGDPSLNGSKWVVEQVEKLL